MLRRNEMRSMMAVCLLMMSSVVTGGTVPPTVPDHFGRPFEDDSQYGSLQDDCATRVGSLGEVTEMDRLEIDRLVIQEAVSKTQARIVEESGQRFRKLKNQLPRGIRVIPTHGLKTLSYQARVTYVQVRDLDLKEG